ncbi:MAG: hypothetical protein MJ175_05475 [Clostridia bacterium]|nr:hypothetical protein [Clostridia bacterium]
MLDIILAGRSYDLGMIFNWGGLFSAIMTNTRADFASTYQKIGSKTQAAIDKFVDAIGNLD